MAQMPAASVDLVLADLPYGVTGCRWDKRIAMTPLWEQYERVLKERGVIALFAQQPFATDLINAARRMFRYEWIWDKGGATGFANARRMPMRRRENVLVFYKRLPAYHPQGLRPCQPHSRPNDRSEVYGGIQRDASVQRFTGYPQSIVAFKRNAHSAACQKPVELLEYLIRTYTAPGETVLDNAMGTGSTCVAAVATGRGVVGFEMDPERFRIAEQRTHDAIAGRAQMPAEDTPQHQRLRCRAAHKRPDGDRSRKRHGNSPREGRVSVTPSAIRHNGLTDR
jgi:site-specific DNA-methyltransferase (adenine-specific)